MSSTPKTTYLINVVVRHSQPGLSEVADVAFHSAVTFRPAGGGDFYWVYRATVAEAQLGLAVGALEDAAEHGIILDYHFAAVDAPTGKEAAEGGTPV